MESQNDRPVFKTIERFEKPYGTRNFIEVALKETNDGENLFFSISKGFTTKTGAKRYKKSLGFAASEELQAFLIDAMQKLMDAYSKMPKSAKSTEPKAEEVKEEVKEEPKKEEKEESTE